MNDHTTRLSRKLEQYDTLSTEEKSVLAELPTYERRFSKGSDIVAEGTRPTVSTLIVDGFCARYTLLKDGRRQISAVHVPGDFVDLHSFLIKKMDHGVAALSPCVVVEVPHDALKRVTQEHPHLSRLLWLSTLADAAIHRQWLVAMGAMNAQARLAHLVCELYSRLDAVGCAQAFRFKLPMTQLELADTLGLSIVHTNRVLQELRGAGLIIWSGSDVDIPDWDKLQELAMYDPTYLSLHQEPR